MGLVLVVYDTLTGQCERFAQKLEEEVMNILDYEPSDEPVFLVTRSWDFGKVPQDTLEFLEENHNKVIGVAVSGNRNWGTNFGAAGDKIHNQYGIELVLKFEGSGFRNDVEYIKEWLKNYRGGKL